MLIVDQLRKADRQLRWMAALVLVGMGILFVGLWRVQVVSSRKYSESLKDQAYRNVLIAAPRGKIIDRNGDLLAENQPRFVVNLYLEDLRHAFTFEYTNNVRRAFIKNYPGVKINSSNRVVLNRAARYNVVSNIVWQVSSAVLPQPLILIEKDFSKHYSESLALPLPILQGLTTEQVALFMERAVKIPGVELEAMPMRVYPHGKLAAHLIGFVRQETSHSDDEGIAFEDKTPVLVGKVGLESSFDEELRGRPGIKQILVNNLGYRQHEEVWSPPLSGQNVSLTLDLEIQKAAENALLTAGPMSGPNVRAAAVVMDIRTGDVLASASSPTYDPNIYLSSVSHEEYQRLLDPLLRPQLNRAFYGSYQPGSIFKIVTSFAALQGNLIDPAQTFYNPGYYMVGSRRIDDTAPPGSYDFRDAFIHSCNSYFIEYGLRVGPQKIIEMGNQFGLGERTGVVSKGQETPGYFPQNGQRFKKDGGLWMDGDTANLAIGQGEIIVTPMQMAVMTAAVANGGKVMRPRIVTAITGGEAGVNEDQIFPPQAMNEVHLDPKNLALVRHAMLSDVVDKDGTGKAAFVEGFNVCGKTGTAQVRLPRSQGGGMDHTTWFVSYAPYEAPRYAVVIMVESGASGGGACAPKAREIYKALQKMEQRPPGARIVGMTP